MDSGTERAILVTGAGGYLGRRIARRLLEAGERDVLLWVRSQERVDELRRELAGFGRRARIVLGDLDDPRPFADVDPESVGSIVHSAAVTRFNVEAELADRVNVEGTRKLVAWAGRCPHLESLDFLSTVYTAGLAEGSVREELVSETPSFANHYERSKFEAERVLVEEGDDLPWRILRLSTVIADDDSGEVTQLNAFHNTLKLLFYGLLSLVPGRGTTPLYFITAGFAADAVVSLMGSGRLRSVYHVCHTRDESLTLEQLIELAYGAFNAEEDFRHRRILRPLFCDAESFDLLADGLDSVGGPVLNQGLASVKPFARQLFSPKAFENERLVASLSRYRAPDPRELAERTCAHLTRTRWGRRGGSNVA